MVLGEAVAGRDGGEGGGTGDVQVEGPELLLGGTGGQQLGQHGAHSGRQAEVTLGSYRLDCEIVRIWKYKGEF